MSIKEIVTIGVPNPRGGKDYQMNYRGEQYEVIRQGSNWYCRGKVYNTLKDVKQHIVAGKAEEPEQQKQSTWDCIDPCALLIANKSVFTGYELVTLDAHGWLTEDGEPDVERMGKEFERYYRLHPDRKLFNDEDDYQLLPDPIRDLK